MAQTGFTVAFIWVAGANPDKAARCVERLGELVPADMAIISVTTSAEMAGLNLSVDASVDSRTMLAELQARALHAGGRFVAVLRPPDGARAPATGDEVEFKDFKTAAAAVRSAVIALAGIPPRQSP